MGCRLNRCVFGAGVLLAVGLGQAIPVLFEGGLPQVAGEDVLALVLGDARLVMSHALMEKADEYFHGGVRHDDCEGLHHEHHEEEDEAHEEGNHGGGPWAWLNRRIHVQEHRHLTGERSAELLPWLWVACRTSPQNVQAYESSAYVLSKMLNRAGEAARLLEEGVEKNPGSLSLRFSLGELRLNALKDGAGAEKAFLSVRELFRVDGREATEEERVLALRALFYLGYLSKRRGDLVAVRGFLAEAEALNPRHVCTSDLRKLLDVP